MRVDSLVAAFTSRPIKFEKLLYDAFNNIPGLPESQPGYSGNIYVSATGTIVLSTQKVALLGAIMYGSALLPDQPLTR